MSDYETEMREASRLVHEADKDYADAKAEWEAARDRRKRLQEQERALKARKDAAFSKRRVARNRKNDLIETKRAETRAANTAKHEKELDDDA